MNDLNLITELADRIHGENLTKGWWDDSTSYGGKAI